MAFEKFLARDARIVVSHKEQTAYGTELVDADIDAGFSFRLNAADMGNISVVRAEEGPKPFTGHEWPTGDDERDIIRDSSLSIALPLNSFMAGWAGALLLGKIASVQEGVTGRYTHTINPTDPLAASGVRQAKVTSIYLDSGSVDASRLRRKLFDLALSDVTISGRIREIVQLAINLIGSGQENITPTIVIPAQTAAVQFSGQSVKVEYGNKGGGLTDITERVREYSLRFIQNLLSDDGYTPGSGKFRDRIEFVDRQGSIDLALFASRANRDLLDDMLNLTRKELKFTFDSGVLAGSSTTNHLVVCRYPDVRISESPLSVDAAGGAYAVRVAENQINRDIAVAATPFEIVVDNTQATYLS